MKKITPFSGKKERRKACKLPGDLFKIPEFIFEIPLLFWIEHEQKPGYDGKNKGKNFLSGE
jgi:hypothetical protein